MAPLTTLNLTEYSGIPLKRPNLYFHGSWFYPQRENFYILHIRYIQFFLKKEALYMNFQKSLRITVFSARYHIERSPRGSDVEVDRLRLEDVTRRYRR